MRDARRFHSRLAITLLATSLLFLFAASAISAPPMGRHYALTLMLLDPETGELDPTPACLSFKRGELCTEADDCGSWEFVERRGHQNEWVGTLDFVEDEGTAIHAEFRGITERLGPGDSIAGTIMLELDGVRMNAAFAGNRVSRPACLEFGLSDD